MIFNLFLVASIILPLSAAIPLLLRNQGREETDRILLLICLLLIARYSLWLLQAFPAESSSFFSSIFYSVECLLLLLYFRAGAPIGFPRRLVNYTLIAAGSATVTIYVANPSHQALQWLFRAQALLIVLLAMNSLHRFRNRFIFIFHSAYFWVIIATAFYFTMQLAIDGGTAAGLLSALNENDRSLLLYSFGIVRLIFYVVAAWLKPGPAAENEWLEDSTD